MLRTCLLISTLLYGLTSAIAQNQADTITRQIQGHWIQSFLENGEAKSIVHEWGAGMYSLKIDVHTFTWITDDPCSGMVDKSICGWKYREADNTLEVISEDNTAWYYELLQLNETTLHLRRTHLPEGSAPDVYGLVYRRYKNSSQVLIPPQIRE